MLTRWHEREGSQTLYFLRSPEAVVEMKMAKKKTYFAIMTRGGLIVRITAAETSKFM